MKPLSYSISQRAVHWLTAALIFFNLLLPEGMETWSRVIARGETPTADQIASANIHAYVGIAILVLAVVRLLLVAIQGKPAVPEDEPQAAKLASAIVHGLLYLSLFILPLTGIAAYYFGVESLGELHHGPLKLLLWAIVALHVAAALVHKFYWKTDVLDRMTKGVKG